jgi:hypothetical protein
VPVRTPRYCRSCGGYLGGNIEHPCPAYREEPPLPELELELDPSFRVVPARTPEELAESLRKVRRAYQ